MRILYFDAVAGASGDMTVAALVSMGVEPGHLQAQLERLPVRGYQIRFSERDVHGIRAVKFDVSLDKDASDRAGSDHRRFRDIRTMIATSELSQSVKERSIAIFTQLAKAEGRVHGVEPEEVAFHELGAVDSIVDIVATAVGIEALRIDQFCASTLPLGSGVVSSRHGTIPVPAPATIEILKGFPVRIDDGEGELVTPTGAAIIAALATPGKTPPPMSVEKIGYGAGARELQDRPNVLRLILGTDHVAFETDDMVVLETNIDDTNPEFYEYVMEQLFAAGARDVWLTPVQMKKNRPATLLRAIAEPGSRDTLAAIILRETSAIGIRYFPVQRIVLPREAVEVTTEFGRISVKISRSPDGSVNIAPEYEACRQVAAERKVPLKSVYQAAVAAARQRD